MSTCVYLALCTKQCELCNVYCGVCTVHSTPCSVKYTVTSPGLVTQDLPSLPGSWSDGHLRRTHGPITAIEVKLDFDDYISEIRAR